MPGISINEEALLALRSFLDKLGVTSYSEVILHLTGVKRLRLRADPTKEKIVVADPLFGPSPFHSHTAWGADCPACRQYIWEDSNTMPITPAERPMKCDFCDQTIKLIYPWEIGDTLSKKESQP